MLVITDSKSTKDNLEKVLQAFDEEVEYTLKFIRKSEKHTVDGLNTLIKSLSDQAIIFISSGITTKYIGKNIKSWTVTPVMVDGKSVFFVPSLNYVLPRSSDTMSFAKVITHAVTIDKSGGIDLVAAKEIPVLDLDTWRRCIKHVLKTGLCCFDYETFTESDQYEDYEWWREDFKASLLSITPQPGISYTIPIEHFDSPWLPQHLAAGLKLLEKYIFGNPDIRKVGWNVKFDMHVCRVLGMKRLEGRYDDGMLMVALLDNTRKKVGLKTIASEIFPYTAGYEDDIKGYAWKDIPLDKLSTYAANDTSLTFLLTVHFEGLMMEDPRLVNLYRNIVAPGLKTLESMEWRGMDVDEAVLDEGLAYASKLMEDLHHNLLNKPQVISFTKYKRRELVQSAVKELEEKITKWEQQESEYIEAATEVVDKLKAELEDLKSGVALGTVEKKEIGKCETKIRRASEKLTPKKWSNYIESSKQKIRDLKTGVEKVYEEVNLSSPQQLSELLYSQHGFGFNSISKSTAEDVIKYLNDPTGFVEGLLMHRKIEKMASTYLTGIKDSMTNGRVHTQFKQHVTATGRLSSSNPNLQNLPVASRVEDPALRRLVQYVKQAMKPPEGCYIEQYDLSQAELRMMAELSGDELMRESYRAGKDLHAVAASKSLRISLEEFYELSPEDQKSNRQKNKARNFGLIFLMSVQGYQDYMKNNYGIELTHAEAKRDHAEFFRLYPGVRRYHKIYEAKAKKFGKVRNWFGRQRWLPNINSDDSFLQHEDIRRAINTPVQGTNGDYMVLGLIHIRNRLGTDIELVNSIHDSALVYVEYDMREKVSPVIKQSMNEPIVKPYFNREWDFLIMKTDEECSRDNWDSMKEIS